MIDKDFKFGMMVFLAILGLLFTVVVMCVSLNVYRDCQYIKAGYAHKLLPCSCHPQWVKESPCGLCGTDDKENGR